MVTDGLCAAAHTHAQLAHTRARTFFFRLFPPATPPPLRTTTDRHATIFSLLFHRLPLLLVLRSGKSPKWVLRRRLSATAAAVPIAVQVPHGHARPANREPTADTPNRPTPPEHARPSARPTRHGTPALDPCERGASRPVYITLLYTRNTRTSAARERKYLQE